MLVPIYILVLGALGVATYTDLKSRTIPNWLVLIVLGLGILNLFLQFELAPSYLISFGIGILVWGSLFYSRLMGGGDAKLMMVLSLLVLPGALFNLYLYILLAGALQALWWRFYVKDTHLPYALSILVGYVVWFVLTLVGI